MRALETLRAGRREELSMVKSVGAAAEEVLAGENWV